MSSLSQPPVVRGPVALRWGRGILWILAVLVALVSWRFLVAEVALVMPAMLHHAQDRPLALYAHIGLAPVALALLPLQFRTRLRVRRPGQNRWRGGLYGV